MRVFTQAVIGSQREQLHQWRRRGKLRLSQGLANAFHLFLNHLLLLLLFQCPALPTPALPTPSKSFCAFAFECNFNYTTLRFRFWLRYPYVLCMPGYRVFLPATCYLLDIVATPCCLAVDPLPFVLVWPDCLANAMQISTLISGHSIDIQFSTQCR